ncbi:substrate-binding domain-containing protein [Levilactobacillus lindianensis]|uniref:substrate-binding domain-containing protein n=1 Tax=Levilactobacillus lindianensis TaxID=2486018 RepID=UPI000F74884E|nr:substrate-binding domain-containing protein [Levilactobacillus lindianensis]
MKGKKYLVVLLTVFAGFSMFLAGCKAVSLTPPSFGTNKTVKKSEKNLKIGVSLSTLSNPFFVSVRDGITKVAKENGSSTQIFDAQNDSAKQSNDVEDLIQKKVDVIIINPVDSDAIATAVKDANNAGIPVIACDRGSNGGKLLTTVASDNVLAGKMAGKFMMSQLSKNDQIAELEGTPGADAAIQRGKGFNSTVKGTLDIVTKQTANFDRAQGMSTTENILQAHPKIKGVFAQNDEMALGAIKAINDPDMVVVSIDGGEQGLKAVKSGKITGIIAQSPKVEGELAVKAAYKHFKGEKVEKATPSPIHLVTKKNVAKFE